MWEPGAQVLDERFKILSVVASEGLSEVYVAEQLSLSRKVALRIFRAAPGAQALLADRFDAEVRRLALVDHPAVVRVIDSGRSGQTPFLVSELAEGPRLGDELKGEPLLPERAVELLTQLAFGLAAIHDQGLVHGDLRPANVALLQEPGGEKARLLDFGLASLVEPASAEGRPTVIGPVIGPIDHLSPEQTAGARADVRSDLYAFGVVAYHSLAGVLPVRGEPKPLAVAAPHLADQIGLGALVMQCLATDPAQRPGSSLELAKQLAALPRPAEPTIFLETMQRPPPVPAGKIAPVAAPPPIPAPAPPPLPPPPAVAAKEPPRPLLASVEMLVVAPTGTAPGLKHVSEAPRAKPWQLAIAAGGAVVTIGLALMLLGGDPTAREARQLLEHHQPAQALEVIGKAQRKLTAPSWPLIALRAAALHQTEAHADEAATFKLLPEGAHEALDPLVLSGLAEDFAKKEDAGLRALLGGLPKKELQLVFEGFAQEPLSARQWGALRYLDLEQATAGLKLVALYSASLESRDCGARKVAAKRLSVLMDDSAEAALNRLRDTPREGAEKNCGQDEAQAALQTLRKSR